MPENGSAKISDWKDLIKVLKQQAAEYEGFHEMLGRKEKALVKGEARLLRELLASENEFVNRLEDLEDLRMDTAAELHPAGRAATLRDLLEAAPEPVSGELEQVAITLIETLNKVALKNKTNSELISSAMEFTNYMINLLSSTTAPEESTYGYTGRIRQADPVVKNLLNKHV